MSIVSFGGMAALIYQKLWQMHRAEEPISETPGLYEIVRPAVEISKHNTRAFLHLVLDKFMALSHAVSLAIARQFLKLANFVKGKRNIARNKGSVSLVWKEMAEEIEQLKERLS
jgi:hypothetical protein